MKLGEYFKKYNIRVSNINSDKQNLSILNFNLNTKNLKNFLDLKKLFKQKKLSFDIFIFLIKELFL